MSVRVAMRATRAAAAAAAPCSAPRATFVSRTVARRGGDGHVHNTFEPETWKKPVIAASVMAVVGGGVGTIWFACHFQNKKHGFKGGI